MILFSLFLLFFFVNYYMNYWKFLCIFGDFFFFGKLFRGLGKIELVVYDICVELNNRIYGFVMDWGIVGGIIGLFIYL